MIVNEATSRKPVASRRAIGFAVGVVMLGAGVAAWAIWSATASRSGTVAASSGKSSGPVTLVVSGDTAGWIVPCGCTSNQSGGLLRRGTYVAERRRTGPVLVADAGGAPGGSSSYQRTRFEAILDGELAMGLAAHNIGEPEAVLGIEYLQKLVREKHVPFVSANLRDSHRRLVFDACRIVEAAGVRVALIGVLKTYAPQGGERDWEISNPQSAVLETLAAIQEKFDRVVVLAHVNETDLRELAAALPEVDAVIGGPTGQSLSPVRIGPTLVASATNKGKFLVSLSLTTNRKGAELAAEVIEMSAQFADDSAQVENVRAFRRELDRRDFDATETGFAEETLIKGPADDRIAGSESCRACHAAAFGQWHGSNHAQAWETLVADVTHVDPFCQQCHTTGYGLPGGFRSRGKSPERVAVGCESCHGPSQAHVEKPRNHTPFAAREQCTRCHDHENSPQFEFESYWKRIVHGREMTNEE